MDTDTFYSAETDLFLNLSQALFLPEESIQVWSIITAQSPVRYFFKGYIYYLLPIIMDRKQKGNV